MFEPTFAASCEEFLIIKTFFLYLYIKKKTLTMPKSKHRKSHLAKLNLYKSNKKKEQELFKKKMIDNYTKMQQELLANQEAHTSTEEVVGPDINLDDLKIDDWNSETSNASIIDVDPIIDVDVNPIIDVDPIINIDNNTTDSK